MAGAASRIREVKSAKPGRLVISFAAYMSARPGDKHLGEPFCNVGFIPTVGFEGLGVELTFTVPGHFDLLEPTSGGHQIARVVTVAIAFAPGATLHNFRYGILLRA
jgi:hypothetical protein